MTGGRGTSAAPLTAADPARRRHWRLVALVVASVSAVVLFVGGTAGPVLLAFLGMLVAIVHLLVGRKWRRPDNYRDGEGQP